MTIVRKTIGVAARNNNADGGFVAYAKQTVLWQ
jgi:hypothetical protein